MNLKRAILANQRRAAADDRARESAARAFMEKSLAHYFAVPESTVATLFSDVCTAANRPSSRIDLLDEMRTRVRNAADDKCAATAYVQYLIVVETIAILNPAAENLMDGVGMMCRSCGLFRAKCNCAGLVRKEVTS